MPAMENQRLNILLIEDDQDDFLIIRHLLSQIPFSDYDIRWVTTGREALDLIRLAPFDACLLDYRLGDEDGLDVLRSLIQEGCKAPVIFLTGHGDHWVDTEAMCAGATDFLVKSQIEANLLERSIRYSIKRKMIEAEIAEKNLELTHAFDELRFKEEELRARHLELARAKQMVELERQRYQSLFDYAPDAYLVTDTHGAIKEANRAAAALLGISRKELTKKPLSRFVSQEYRDSFWRHLSTLTPAEGPKRHEILLAPEKRDPVWASMSITAEKLNGELNVRWLIRDISEEKAADEALKRSKELFEKTFSSQLAAILVLDDAMPPRIIDSNPAAVRMFGYCREEMLGRTTGFLYSDRAAASAFGKCVMETVSESGFAEFRMKKKNGKLFPAEHSVVPLLDNGGERFGWVVVADDITERVEAEQAINEGAERIKRFAYSIYHDLKNPAIALRWFADRLAGGYGQLLDDKGREYCDRVLRISEEIVLFLDKINQYISTQEISLCLETIDLSEVFRLIRDEFLQRMRAGAIRWLAPEHPILLRADRLCLIRSLRNLVENALKYGGDKLSEISLEYKESEEFHTIALKDDGYGIKTEEIDKVFEIFQRGGSSKGIPGAGLGLGIVKEIADRHGGRVWAEPAGAGGVIFYLSLSKRL